MPLHSWILLHLLLWKLTCKEFGWEKKKAAWIQRLEPEDKAGDPGPSLSSPSLPTSAPYRTYLPWPHQCCHELVFTAQAKLANLPHGDVVWPVQKGISPCSKCHHKCPYTTSTYSDSTTANLWTSATQRHSPTCSVWITPTLEALWTRDCFVLRVFCDLEITVLETRSIKSITK